MTEPADTSGPSREEEVLRARRASLERLGDRAFALTLKDALGVDEPVATADLRARYGDLPGPSGRGDGHRRIAWS